MTGPAMTGNSLTSTYHLVRQAIVDRCCLTAVHLGEVRHFVPHSLGLDRSDRPKVLAFQYAGGTTTILPPDGDWRCFAIGDLVDVRRNGDPWKISRAFYRRANRCVMKVDISV